MKFITTLVWVCTFLFSAFSAKGQSPFAEADRWMNEGLFEQAAVAYEYVLYQNQTDTIVFIEGIFKKLNCLKKQQNYAAIPSLLHRISNFSLNDSVQFYYYYERSLAYYLSGNFKEAAQSLLPVFNINLPNPDSHRAAIMLYAFTLNELTQWRDCRTMLKDYINSQNTSSQSSKDSLLHMIDASYADDEIPKLKSLKKAHVLSLLFPGLGQAYNGDYAKGLLSLSLTGASAAYIAYNIINTTYITAGTAGVYLFLYFYYGGVNQHLKLVPQKNAVKKSKYNNHLKNTLVELNNRLAQLP